MRKLFLLSLPLLLLFWSGCSKNDTPDPDPEPEPEETPSGKWLRTGNFIDVGRSYAVTFTIGKDIYLSTGYTGAAYMNDLWVRDPKTWAWTQMASIGAEGGEEALVRGYSVGFSLESGGGAAGYVGLGYTSDSQYLRDFWRFDPSSNRWTKLNDFGGTARYGAVAFVVNNKAYVGTGYDGEDYLKDFWQYDPAADSWKRIDSFNGSKRRGAMTFIIGPAAYVVGGENNGQGVDDFWAFDGLTETWIRKRTISDASPDDYDDDYEIVRRYGAAFALDGKAYISCGDLSNILRNDTWEYDPLTDLWKREAVLDGPARTGAIGFSASGYGFLATGRGGSSCFNDVYQFLPPKKPGE